ncbi:hypothetical protein H8S95_05740 [Pontibacter sp. KCTC 32443]|uniref:hypothetical protein n=1 Tax=Pontibacter TaxID=323449 RepID=UPI00164CF85B|nr:MULTISPECIES: hypothetical protein [Pontibacter]MBC5773558.1 hypothetical protein [Pontibacter sp. KCTC 32443]
MFQDSIEDGVFYTSTYFNNSSSTKAIALDAIAKEQWSYSNSVNDAKRSPLSEEKVSTIKDLIAQVEQGAFRQVCYNGPSEGSMSILLVKSDGIIVMKYEASQYDYTQLNESERAKIKNALELIQQSEKN